jgi:hypothetical protein
MVEHPPIRIVSVIMTSGMSENDFIGAKSGPR